MIVGGPTGPTTESGESLSPSRLAGLSARAFANGAASRKALGSNGIAYRSKPSIPKPL